MYIYITGRFLITERSASRANFHDRFSVSLHLYSAVLDAVFILQDSSGAFQNFLRLARRIY